MRRHSGLTLALALTTAACASTSAQQPPLGATGVILVANQQGASASLIDLKDGSMIEIPVGNGPHETAISHDGRTGVVTVYGTQVPGNQLAIIDLRTAKVTKMIDLGRYTRPHGAAFLPGDRQIVATSESTGNVVIVDIASGSVEAVPTKARGSHMLALSRDGSKLFTANISDGSISEIDVESRAYVASNPISTMTEGVAVSSDGRFVWVGSNNANTVTVFDNATKTKAATLTMPGAPYRIGVTPDYRLALIADPVGGFIHFADTNTYQLTGRVALDGGPQGIAISPDSKVAFITLNGGDAVAMIDLATQEDLRRFAVGNAPDGIAYTAHAR